MSSEDRPTDEFRLFKKIDDNWVEARVEDGSIIELNHRLFKLTEVTG